MKIAILVMGLVLASGVHANANSESTEKTLGPVVLVERTFVPQLDSLLANLKQAGTRYKSLVRVYESNGTEVMVPALNNLVDAEYTIGDVVVSLFVGPFGYAATVERASSSTKALNLTEVRDALAFAVAQQAKAVKPLGVRVQLVK